MRVGKSPRKFGAATFFPHTSTSSISGAPRWRAADEKLMPMRKMRHPSLHNGRLYSFALICAISSSDVLSDFSSMDIDEGASPQGLFSHARCEPPYPSRCRSESAGCRWRFNIFPHISKFHHVIMQYSVRI